MKHPKVISGSNMPTRLPILPTMLFWLALDRIHAPGWAWGIVGTLMAIVWIVCIYLLFVEEKVDIFDDPRIGPK